MTITINEQKYTVNKVWYISPDGNDNTGDGSKANPYFSIKKANSEASNGDAICLASGVYNYTDKEANNEVSFGYDSSTGNKESGSTIPCIFLSKDLIVYSKNPSKTTIEFNIASTGRRQACINMAYITSKMFNLYMIFKTSVKTSNSYENEFFGDVSYAYLENCVIESYNSNTKQALVYDNLAYHKELHNCVIINNNEWFDYNYSGKVSLYNCIFSNTPPSGNILNDCDIIAGIKNTIFQKHYTDNSILVGLYYSISSYAIRIGSSLYIATESYYNKDTGKYDQAQTLQDLSSLEIDDLFDTPDYLNGDRVIDKFNGDIQIINPDYKIGDVLKLKGIKSTRELVVASGDINNGVAQTINSIIVDTTKSDNASIKLALSIDEGETWKTHDGANWQDLPITIPKTKKDFLSSSELTQWNEARDVIYSSGIDISLFNSLNFNTLTSTQIAPNTIRFAYVLDRPSYSDRASTTQMTWSFNAKGSMKKMKETEYDAELYEHQIKFTSLIDNAMMIVNVII